MRTRKHDFLDTRTNTPVYSVQVFVDGKWQNAMFKGKPLLCATEAERDASRKVISAWRSPVRVAG